MQASHCTSRDSTHAHAHAHGRTRTHTRTHTRAHMSTRKAVHMSAHVPARIALRMSSSISHTTPFAARSFVRCASCRAASGAPSAAVDNVCVCAHGLRAIQQAARGRKALLCRRRSEAQVLISPSRSSGGTCFVEDHGPVCACARARCGRASTYLCACVSVPARAFHQVTWMRLYARA